MKCIRDFSTPTMGRTLAVLIVLIFNLPLSAYTFEEGGIRYDSMIPSPIHERNRVEATISPISVIQLSQSGTLLEQIGIKDIERV